MLSEHGLLTIFPCDVISGLSFFILVILFISKSVFKMNKLIHADSNAKPKEYY